MPPRSSAREQTSPGPASMAAGWRVIWTYARPAPGGGQEEGCPGKEDGKEKEWCASRPGCPEVNAGGDADT
eukprot:scaffold24720_cov61-Phaeocystis_antarctica.AAC.2